MLKRNTSLGSGEEDRRRRATSSNEARLMVSTLIAAVLMVTTQQLFAPIAQGLKQSAVPVLVPGTLPADDLHGLRAELRSAGRDGYTIELDYAADCNGATACYLGRISGERSNGSKPPGSKVALSGGTTGYFVLGPCGASCSDSTMTFDRGGYRYVFAEKGASRDSLAQWASSIVTLPAWTAVDPCASAVTQLDLDRCWSARAKDADAQLNATYATVVAGLRALRIGTTALVGVQKAWITARDASCDFEESLYRGGSIAPMEGAMCVERMTQRRTQRLQAYLATMRAHRWKPVETVSATTDAELNRLYKLYLRQIDALQKEKLTVAELAWIRYRDRACALEGGACMTELDRDRTTDLKAAWIADPFW